MLPAHFVLCVLSCIAFSGVTHAIYEDCKTPPPVDHARAELFESEHINTAIYSCASGYVMKGENELICNVDTEEWQGEPPICLKNKVTIHHSERKKKMLSIPEELNVDLELAQQLDLSCIQAKVQAPEINHGIIAKYERRRRGDKVFLVAYYECNENYDFERTQVNALYCSIKQWVGELPTCLPRVEYKDQDDDDDDDDDYDEYETIDNDAAEEMDSESQIGESADPVAPPPPLPPPVEENENELVEQFEPQVAPVDRQVEPQPEPNVVEPQVEPEPELSPPEAEPEIVVHVNEPEPEPVEEPEPKETPATDINIVVAPTKDPYSPRLLDEDCGKDNGGCAHLCERLLFPSENEPRLKCSCNEGYTLDPQDYARCHDIDECQESNGGCSQICNNLPGGFECACEKGYQIDSATGNTCVDIDECAVPELSAECSNGCENTPGSYRCVIPLNTKAEAEQESHETDQDNEIDLTPVAQPEEPTAPTEENVAAPAVEPTVVQPSCNPGFALSVDGIECQDINECDIVVEDNENADHVPHRVCQQQCKNTIGSYRCSCHEGFHLLEDESSCAPDTCEDLDNPQLNRTRCAHQCENLVSGGYECVCPDGYKLGQDLHSCEVLETVCSREQGHERCRPGTCVTNEDNSTFSCLCPKGYTSEVFSCQDVDECAMGNHKCSHDCFNTAGSYQCLCPRGMSLQEPDGHTCVAPDPCAVNNNGCEQLCLSADGGACTCSKGYVLSSDGKSCSDVDECEVKNGGCQQLCRNLPGSYECQCATGYELLDVDGLDGYCFDIDECATNAHGCDAPMRCENLNGSYTCLCEKGYALGISSSSSSSSLSQSSSSSALTSSLACLDIDECSLSNANCSHFCLNQPGSFQCACADGFQLAADGFTCLDIDECARDFGNCSSICINLLGSHACACDRGYELTADGHSCQDVDECAGLLSGGCTHECINRPGSYECGCPLGYMLQEDERSCRPALVGCPPGTKHTEQGCEPIECELGMLLGADGSCVDIDECRLNNGGCSHQCRNSQGSFKCECPAGYTLSENSRDCVDVDECVEKNGGCEDSCINVPGSFRCECAEGKRLSFDERSCYTVPKIEPRVSVGLPAPVAPNALAPPVMPVRPMPTLRPVSYPSLPATTQPTFEVRDQCVRFQAPANGQAHCNRYRHKRKLFYNTRCKVRCNAGYQLLGSEIRSCGASGNWEGQDNQCVPISQPRLWNVGTPRSAPRSSACPALPTPRNGVISPASCTRGASSFGTVCHLQCNMGFVPVAGMLTSCMNGWALGSVLECKPFANIFGNQISPRVQSPWQLLQQQTPFRQQSIQQVRRQQLPVQTHTPTAYIKCPENVVILLNPHQTLAHVILQRPATNVDYRHVVAFPAWAKQLQGHLPAGIHKIIYRAHDPVTQQSVGCQTVITIKQASPQVSMPSFPSFRPAETQAFRSASLPQFRPARVFNFGAQSESRPFASLIDASPLTRRSESLIAERPAEETIEESSPSRNSESTRIDLGSSTSSYCPPSFEVHLKENQNLRSVVWEEPRFEGKLLKIYKSSFPGALFGQGDHDIKYEATTTDGRTLRCNFQIHVRAASPTPAPKPAELNFPDFSPAPAALTQPTHSSLFAGHESYVVCPGKEPVKVTDRQSVDLPVGCTLKNVRPQTATQTHPKRGLLTSLWRHYNHF